MAQQIESEILIEAPVQRVWRILIDFDRYPDWNPFIPRITGTAEAGRQLQVRLTPPDGMAMSFKPSVLAATPERELRWLGKLLVRGLFDGEHAFQLQAESADTTRFTQSERFSGALVPLLMMFARKSTLSGFEAMNQALKQRAESETT